MLLTPLGPLPREKEEKTGIYCSSKRMIWIGSRSLHPNFNKGKARSKGWLMSYFTNVIQKIGFSGKKLIAEIN